MCVLYLDAVVEVLSALGHDAAGVGLPSVGIDADGDGAYGGDGGREGRLVALGELGDKRWWCVCVCVYEPG